MKLKQTRAENEQLKADMRKRGHVENQSQPRDNSAEASATDWFSDVAAHSSWFALDARQWTVIIGL